MIRLAAMVALAFVCLSTVWASEFVFRYPVAVDLPHPDNTAPPPDLAATIQVTVGEHAAGEIPGYGAFLADAGGVDVGEIEGEIAGHKASTVYFALSDLPAPGTWRFYLFLEGAAWEQSDLQQVVVENRHGLDTLIGEEAAFFQDSSGPGHSVWSWVISGEGTCAHQDTCWSAADVGQTFDVEVTLGGR